MDILKYKNKHYQKVIELLEDNIPSRNQKKEIKDVVEFLKNIEVRSKIHKAWVGLDRNGEVIGFIAIVISEDETKIGRLDIRQDAQRKGYGSKLINKIKKNYKAPISLVTYIDDKQAKNFYKKNGFIEVKPYINKETSQEYIQMKWDNSKS